MTDIYHYHMRLHACRWYQRMLKVDREFFGRRTRNARAKKIFAAHERRVRGKGSPAECDDVFNEVTK